MPRRLGLSDQAPSSAPCNVSPVSDAERTPTESSGSRISRLRFPRFRWILLGVLGLLVILWVVPVLVETISEGGGLEGAKRPYLLIFGFVSFDAIIPIFPSESLLTAASTLAGQEASDINLWLVILAGALGAIVGDSLLYWLSRTVGHNVLSRKLEHVQKNEKVAVAMQVLGQTAPLLITLGRFVPGVRFAVNVTMGVGRYSYPKFLLFSSMGGTAWAFYTCAFSFWIGQALDGYPVLSIATSALITTALLALMYFPLKRRYQQAQEDSPPAAS